MKRTLSNREEMVVNRLRAGGLTIKEVASIFELPVSTIQEADPIRRAYKRGYEKAKRTYTKR